jgi:O-antigen/teichoic acid export membrane protein
MKLTDIFFILALIAGIVAVGVFFMGIQQGIIHVKYGLTALMLQGICVMAMTITARKNG